MISITFSLCTCILKLTPDFEVRFWLAQLFWDIMISQFSQFTYSILYTCMVTEMFSEIKLFLFCMYIYSLTDIL